MKPRVVKFKSDYMNLKSFIGGSETFTLEVNGRTERGVEVHALIEFDANWDITSLAEYLWHVINKKQGHLDSTKSVMRGN